MDPLEILFVFCFVFGLAMSGLSFLLGSLHLPGLGHQDGGHALGDGHGHAELGHSRGVHADVLHHGGGHLAHGAEGHGGHAPAEGAPRAPGEGPSPVNVNTATAFLAFFGGVGYVLYGTFGVGAAIALILSVLAGLGGGAVVFFFLVKILLAGQRYLDPADFRMEGSIAQVTRAIRPDGIGEIVFTRDGTRRSEGARSATGEAIPAGSEVVILRYEKGLAFVEPWTSYVEGTSGHSAS
jgi:hypothetical protein